MPVVHSSAKRASVDPDPSGVRLAEDGPDRYLGDDEERIGGSFFDDDEDVATDSVWNLYVKDSVRRGHAPDIKARADAHRTHKPGTNQFHFGNGNFARGSK